MLVASELLKQRTQYWEALGGYADRISAHIKNLSDVERGVQEIDQKIFSSDIREQATLVLAKIAHSRDLVHIHATVASAGAATPGAALTETAQQLEKTMQGSFREEAEMVEFSLKVIGVSAAGLTNQALLSSALQLRDDIRRVQSLFVAEARVRAVK
jgi:hypothetical protein